MNYLKQFFVNSYVLLISAIITIITFICHSFYLFNNMNKSSINTFLGFVFSFMAVMVILLLVAYVKGESAYQKTLIGSILTAFTFTQMLVLSGNVAIGVYSVNYEVIMTILVFMIFISYLYLQVDHKGDIGIIKINFAIFAIACFMLVLKLVQNIMYSSSFVDYLWTIEFISFLIMIICIETRITKYKVIRFENLRQGTWTQKEKEKQKLLFKLF